MHEGKAVLTAHGHLSGVKPEEVGEVHCSDFLLRPTQPPNTKKQDCGKFEGDGRSMSQEVLGRCCGGVSGETLHMLYDAETNRFLMEPARSSSSSPVARALVEALRLVLASEGSLPEPKFISSSGVENSSTEKTERATAAQPAPEQQTNSQTSSPRLGWRLGDLLLRRSQQAPEKTSTASSTDSSKKPAGSFEEILIEDYDEHGRLYHKRVAVEG